MTFHTPAKVYCFRDRVVLVVPSLSHAMKPLLEYTLMYGYAAQRTSWRFAAWEENQHYVTLNVMHGPGDFRLLFPPNMWEFLAEIHRVPTLTIITNDNVLRSDGTVTSITLDYRSRLRQTSYLIKNHDAGVNELILTLRRTRETWNPNGVLTYLLHILGEPLETGLRL